MILYIPFSAHLLIFPHGNSIDVLYTFPAIKKSHLVYNLPIKRILRQSRQIFFLANGFFFFSKFTEPFHTRTKVIVYHCLDRKQQMLIIAELGTKLGIVLKHYKTINAKTLAISKSSRRFSISMAHA